VAYSFATDAPVVFTDLPPTTSNVSVFTESRRVDGKAGEDVPRRLETGGQHSERQLPAP
jgi:hypothetical protein